MQDYFWDRKMAAMRCTSPAQLGLYKRINITDRCPGSAHANVDFFSGMGGVEEREECVLDSTHGKVDVQVHDLVVGAQLWVVKSYSMHS